MPLRRSLLDTEYRSNNEVAPNILPLVDVVFLLLVFFIVTSTFIRHQHLNIDLPQADTPNQLVTQAKEVLVGVDSYGNYTVNGKYLADNSERVLIAAIQSASNKNTSLPLAIAADAKAPYQTVITVLDVVGTIGFAHIRLSVQDGKTD